VVGTAWTTGVYKFDGTSWTTLLQKKDYQAHLSKKLPSTAKEMFGLAPMVVLVFLMKDSKINISADTISISSLLHQNYPNPFNLTTIVLYKIENSGHVTLSVYNVN